MAARAYAYGAYAVYMHMQCICSVHALYMQVWGSPWQPEFCGWAFNLRRGEACAAKWRLIPTATDVLVTHGPPLGHGDLCHGGKRVGNK